MFQTNELDKTSGKELNETVISNLPGKEFKVMVIKLLTHWTWEKNGNTVRTSTRS